MFTRTKEICQKLKMSRSGFEAFRKKHSDFPKPIKIGNTRQSPVFYKTEELDKWIANLNSNTFNMENENESK